MAIFKETKRDYESDLYKEGHKTKSVFKPVVKSEKSDQKRKYLV